MAYLGNSPANALFNLSPPVALAAGQTVVPINYTPGRTLFLLNGAVQTLNDDITATNGINVTLTRAAVMGDQLVAVNFASFSVAGALPLIGGSMGGPIALAGGDTGVTPAQFDNSTKLATTAFVLTQGFTYSSVPLLNSSRTAIASDVGALVFINAASLTYTLPLPSTLGIAGSGGQVITLTGSSNAVTIVPGAGVTLFTELGNGVANIVLPQGATISLQAGTSGWRAIGGSGALAGSGVFGSVLTGNGYQKLPSGLILQWGNGVSSGTSSPNATVTFPFAFPNAALGVVATILGGVTQGSVSSTSKTQTTATLTTYNGTTIVSAFAYQWIAIGN